MSKEKELIDLRIRKLEASVNMLSAITALLVASAVKNDLTIQNGFQEGSAVKSHSKIVEQLEEEIEILEKSIKLDEGV